MTLLIFCAVGWVFAATAVAFLPMRRQYAPGVVLLALAPVLILALGWTYGWIAGLAALFGFVSMFRNPLRYFWKKWRGLPLEVPE